MKILNDRIWGNGQDVNCNSVPDSLPACRRAPSVQRPNCKVLLKRSDLGVEGRASSDVQDLREPLARKLRKTILAQSLPPTRKKVH